MNSLPAPHPLPQIYATLEAGRPEEAERLARHNLALAPHDEGAQLLLAMALQRQKRLDEAVERYRRLAEDRPQSKDHWSNLGTALREAGRLDEAGTAYARALALAPGDALLRYNVGLLAMERAHYAQARLRLLEAVEAAPDFLPARVYAAMMCYECGDNPNAERLIEGWQRWQDLDADTRIELAWLLIQLGDAAAGERLLEAALARGEGDPLRLRALLVQVRERVNRLDEALALAQELPDPETVADPAVRNEIIAAQALVAGRSNDLPAARALLERQLALVDGERKRSNLYFSLGHVCDKQGDYAAAMAAFERAHASQMMTAGEVVPELLDPAVEPMRIASHLIDPAVAARWPRFEGPPAAQSPVFVVGFPRSGTTMLEQMLDAHPSMRSMDERAFLQGVIEHMQRMGVTYPEAVGDLDESQLAALRTRYWQSAAKVAPLAPGQRLVDKNPLNLLRLPMIARLFPHAKVILCLRHPCDVLMSCYMQSFRSPNFAVLCSSLERLARGYVNAMRSWIHHAALLRPDLLVWRYETALEDFSGEVRRAAAFLELEDAAPLERFHEHARAKGFISTPSYHQVAQPLNKNALDRWRRYEDHFRPVLPILAPILQHWGYDV